MNTPLETYDPFDEMPLTGLLVESAINLQKAGKGEMYDWWQNYWTARLILRKIALDAVSSDAREQHPDRRSMEFKSVSNDMTDDMKCIENPYLGWVKCEVCGNTVPPGPACFSCFIIERLGPIPYKDPPPEAVEG